METFEILKLIDSDLLGINAGLLVELLSGNKDIGLIEYHSEHLKKDWG